MSGALLRDVELAKDGSAVVEGEARLSWAEIRAGSEDLARRLVASGHRRTLVRSDRPSDVVMMLLAADSAGSDLFVAHAALPEETLRGIADRHGVTGILDEGELRSSGAPGPRENPGAPRIFLMSSGTTSQPKLAIHSLDSLTASIKRTPSSAAARWLLTFPPTGFAGLQVLLSAVIGGGTLLVPPRRTPTEFVETALRHDATHISGTPTFWRSFLVAIGERSISGLRHVTLGGEAADQATLDRLFHRFPHARIVQIYASTEAGSLFHVDDGRAGFPAAWLEDAEARIGLRIRDGLLEVRSPRRMIAYASDHEDPSVEEGWMATRDEAYVSGDRVLFGGRADSRINVAGYKVQPEEVEFALMTLDEVAEARVTGQPSAMTGHILVAELVCRPGAEPAAVRERAVRHMRDVLEPQKVPRIVRVVGAIEAAPSGKKHRSGASP